MTNRARQHFSRRGIISSLAASAAILVRGAPVNASDPVTPMNYCYWRNEFMDRCYGGIRYERWCYICNDPGTGWTTYKCEWRPDGPC